MQWNITPGTINQTATRAFKNGCCGALAAAEYHTAAGYLL